MCLILSNWEFVLDYHYMYFIVFYHVYIMLLYHDTFLFILCTCIIILSYSYHNPAPWSWLLTVAGNSNPTWSLDRLWERLQDHVPHLHGEHLVGVQGALQPGTSLQRVKGHALLHGLQHPTVQLWVWTELQGCGWPSRCGFFYSIDKLLYFYIDITIKYMQIVCYYTASASISNSLIIFSHCELSPLGWP